MNSSADSIFDFIDRMALPSTPIVGDAKKMREISDWLEGKFGKNYSQAKFGEKPIVKKSKYRSIDEPFEVSKYENL